MKTPKVSVIMGVFNAGEYLRPAIDSILNQTFSDFEFIIIDDGSTDGSRAVINSYKDQRIRSVPNEVNLGIARTMNKALGLATGEYVAKMDADDISLPNRFAEQIKFMDAHQSVGACGTWVKVIGDKTEYVWRYETESEKIKARLLFACAMANPTVMLRRALLQKYNLSYRFENVVAEDYDLWVRAAQCFDFANLPTVLLHYRVHNNNNTTRVMTAVKKSAVDITLDQVARLGITPTEDELATHTLSSMYSSPKTAEFVAKVANWYTKLQAANADKKVYNQKALGSVLGLYWYSLLVKSIGGGSWVYKEFRDANVSKNLTIAQKLKFLIKYLLAFHYGK